MPIVDPALVAAAELGEEARKFLESDLGKCLLGMALQEADLAKDALSKVDPSDFKKITELQNTVRLYQSFKDWLGELVDEGNSALEIFKQQKD